jgi:Ca2+-dependent lipid-binding protein
MDPYVHIHVGKWQDWRSPVCRGGGKNPKWNETNFFDIEVKHRTQMARIEVRDQEGSQQPIIGHIEFPI